MTPEQFAKFEARYVADPNSGCWLWTGALQVTGYGTLYLGNAVAVLAHRASYAHFVGPIPIGMCVCHRCDVRSCVNPGHFFLGTIADNMADKIAKGRQAKGANVGARGERNGLSRLTDDDVVAILRMLSEGTELSTIAEAFGVSRHAIKHIERGRTWAHIPRAEVRNVL